MSTAPQNATGAAAGHYMTLCGLPVRFDLISSEHSNDHLNLQVSDFAVGTLSTPNRLVPGDGDIPLRRIVDQLLDAGYEGVFDLELVGPKIEEEGYRGAIARSSLNCASASRR